MHCTCPKCHAQIEVELAAEVTEEGSTASCPACNARFNVHRESFAARALRKAGEISCAACGNELGPELHCRSCGIPFPSYIVIGSGRKRSKAKRSALKLDINIFPSRKAAINVPSLSMSPEESKGTKKVERTGKAALAGNRIVAVALVAVLAVAIAGGAGLYFKKKAETAYMRNFAVACYAIQVGADKSRKISQKVATDWKSKMDQGQSFSPRLSADDDREMAAVRTKLETVKAKLAKTPEKFSSCNDQLANLETAFNKLRSVSASPGNSLPEFNNSVSQANVQYKQAASQLKAGLPPELMDELRASAKKYRGLRPLLQEG
jgi:hypothetical protein